MTYLAFLHAVKKLMQDHYKGGGFCMFLCRKECDGLPAHHMATLKEEIAWEMGYRSVYITDGWCSVRPYWMTFGTFQVLRDWNKWRYSSEISEGDYMAAKKTARIEWLQRLINKAT